MVSALGSAPSALLNVRVGPSHTAGPCGWSFPVSISVSDVELLSVFSVKLSLSERAISLVSELVVDSISVVSLKVAAAFSVVLPSVAVLSGIDTVGVSVIVASVLVVSELVVPEFVDSDAGVVVSTAAGSRVSC